MKMHEMENLGFSQETSGFHSDPLFLKVSVDQGIYMNSKTYYNIIKWRSLHGYQ